MSTKRKREQPKPPSVPVSQETMRALLKYRRKRRPAPELLSQGLGGPPPYLGQSIDEPFSTLLADEEITATQIRGGYEVNRLPENFRKALREAAPGAVTAYSSCYRLRLRL
jgi:integrase